MTDFTIQAEGITRRFGALVAVDECSFDLLKGEIHALIGSNGSGKSTLCKVISGALAADSGTVRFHGEPVVFAGPLDARRRGIATVYQELSLIPTLSVMENILLGSEPRTATGNIDRNAMAKTTDNLIASVGSLASNLNPRSLVGHLSIDQQQVVEILKALVLSPKVILFDESTSSLDKSQVGSFFELLRGLKSQGVSIIFISHRMEEIFAIADRVTIMRNGKYIATKTTLDIDREDLVSLMVGGKRQTKTRKRGLVDGSAILAVSNLKSGKLSDISFDLRPGEILGLGGLHGQGQSDLLLSLFGAKRITAGTVALEGKPYEPTRPNAALRAGLAYVSGDRGRTGALIGRPIIENLALSKLSRENRFVLSRKGLARGFAALIERLQLKFGRLSHTIETLSGGNQQKVILGRALGTNPRVLLLDDPTKGIDVHAKEDLYVLVRELCDKGMAVILYSSEDTELLENADRVLVFNSGRVVDELTQDRLTEFDLYSAALRSAA